MPHITIESEALSDEQEESPIHNPTDISSETGAGEKCENETDIMECQMWEAEDDSSETEENAAEDGKEDVNKAAESEESSDEVDAILKEIENKTTVKETISETALTAKDAEKTEKTVSPVQAEKTRSSGKRGLRPKTVILRTLLALFTLIAEAVGGLLAGIWIIEKGPSEKARDLFVVSMMETSAAKFVPTLFLKEEKVREIIKANSMQAVNYVSDTNLVVIGSGNGGKNPGGNPFQDPSDNNHGKPENTIPGSDNQPVDPDGDGIDIVDIKGSTYKGKMMIVYDPTRVFVGISGAFGKDKYGKRLMDIYNSYDNVVGAINGGGWVDTNGQGSGGMPLGLVLSQGKVLWEQVPGGAFECCGITGEGKLIVGTFTAKQAVSWGVRDVIRFGPSLIINSNPIEALGSGSGLNPRTAIGQRADGAMLLLAIDGRRTDSIGASLVDVQDQMLKFGAVNAYNLDGGSSTTMIHNGEYINNNASMVGYRSMCTAILVRGK